MKKLIRTLAIAALALLATGYSGLALEDSEIRRLASSEHLVAAAKAFRGSFGSFIRENGLKEHDFDEYIQRSLATYYRGEFSRRFHAERGYTLAWSSIDNLLSSLDDVSLAFQYYYISTNHNSPTEKHLLDCAKDYSTWSAQHLKFHPFFREYIAEHNLYDLFIVDVDSGYIVYSVLKESDFATSLVDGPYAETLEGCPYALTSQPNDCIFLDNPQRWAKPHLGQTFRSLRSSTDPEIVIQSDTVSYFPSLEKSVQFMGTPIHDGNQQIAVLIVQLPPVEHDGESPSKLWYKSSYGAGID